MKKNILLKFQKDTKLVFVQLVLLIILSENLCNSATITKCHSYVSDVRRKIQLKLLKFEFKTIKIIF